MPRPKWRPSKNMKRGNSSKNQAKSKEPVPHVRKVLPFPINKASPASVERLQDRASEEELTTIPKEDLVDFDDNLETSNPNFKTELEYDGYHSIEESDNDSFNSLDLERSEEPKGGLTILDREENPDSGEESIIDPQENRK